jgi:hypothetical protein
MWVSLMLRHHSKIRPFFHQSKVQLALFLYVTKSRQILAKMSDVAKGSTICIFMVAGVVHE